MLETVKDVSEQVKTVEESVRKAKESEQAAEGHRTAVEEMKNSVEQTASGITQVVQTGVQEINSAKQSAVQEVTQTGTAQKTAVESAGTQAVENVENVKASATTAVETVKTEAVQSVQTEGNTQTGNVTTEGTKQVKAVQDKGAEVLQSIPENFATQMETKLNKQQGIENKGKVLVIGEDGNVVPEEVASGGGDGIAIINTMSGESPLVIPDSAERVNKRLELGGKTEQVQTTGKNLFDPNNNYEDLVWIRNDGEIVGGSNARTSDYIPVEQGNYAFQFDIPNPNQMFVAGYNADRAFVKIVGIISKGKCIIKIDDIQIETIRLSYTRESTRIQLERSETQTPYEPYTGGKPSPSPEYPQEIKNSGKWNEGTQKYEIEVVLSGKNLLDITACEDGKTLDANGNIVNNANALLSDFIPCFSKTSYCRVEGHFTAVSFYDVEKNKIGSINQYDPCFATPDKCRYFRFSLNKTKADYEKAVANVGTALMDYEPHKKPQFLTLTSDRPLTKWDRLVEQGGQIGWLYQSKIVSLTGGEEWKTSLNAFYTTTYNFIKNYEAKCSHYVLAGITNQEKNNIFSIGEGAYTNSLWIRDTSFSAVQDFKAHLSDLNEKSDPIMVVSPAAQTEFIPLPQSEQNAIRALKTYYPTTVITVDGGELDPDVEVTYTADTKNYIDNKVSAKVASIIRQYRLNTENLLSLMPMETQAAMIENDTNNILENAEEMKHE